MKTIKDRIKEIKATSERVKFIMTTAGIDELIAEEIIGGMTFDVYEYDNNHLSNYEELTADTISEILYYIYR